VGAVAYHQTPGHRWPPIHPGSHWSNAPPPDHGRH
jgi:hypothetical protein